MNLKTTVLKMLVIFSLIKVIAIVGNKIDLLGAAGSHE